MGGAEGVCDHCGEPLVVKEQTDDYLFSRCENPECDTHQMSLQLSEALLNRYTAEGLEPKFEIGAQGPFPDGRWVRPSSD
jgi:hypothetical protein